MFICFLKGACLFDPLWLFLCFLSLSRSVFGATSHSVTTCCCAPYFCVVCTPPPEICWLKPVVEQVRPSYAHTLFGQQSSKTKSIFSKQQDRRWKQDISGRSLHSSDAILVWLAVSGEAKEMRYSWDKFKTLISSSTVCALGSPRAEIHL